MALPFLRHRNSAINNTDFTIESTDEIITDYVLDTDLVIDGNREQQLTVIPTNNSRIIVQHGHAPSLVLGTRVFMGESNKVHLSLPLKEPTFERRAHGIVVTRIRREIVIDGKIELLWRILSLLDGRTKVHSILSLIAAKDRKAAENLLVRLSELDALDTSNRSHGRLIHSLTKKGVLAGGALSLEEALAHVTDKKYKSFQKNHNILLHDSVQEALIPFYKLTRNRRSKRDYNGMPTDFADIESILVTACGKTGTLEWNNRRIWLRAYPSSGGLYSVEIYPVALAVTGLRSGMYHYNPSQNKLALIKEIEGHNFILDSVLPPERAMISGVACMVCLAGNFVRHEKKYGQGGYRMLVAEAGHISQNLILAATALGLSARPFGGVFDDSLNNALGFHTDTEQFLLSVIIGKTDSKTREKKENTTSEEMIDVQKKKGSHKKL